MITISPAKCWAFFCAKLNVDRFLDWFIFDPSNEQSQKGKIMQVEMVRFNDEYWPLPKPSELALTPSYQQSIGRVIREGFSEPRQDEMLAEIKQLRKSFKVLVKPFIARSSVGVWVCRKERGQTNTFCVWGRNPTHVYLAWLRYFASIK